MKLIIIGVLFYLLYSVAIKPMLSNNKMIDTKEWDQEEDEFVDYEEIDD